MKKNAFYIHNILLRNLFLGARKTQKNHELPFGALDNFAHNIQIHTVSEIDFEALIRKKKIIMKKTTFGELVIYTWGARGTYLGRSKKTLGRSCMRSFGFGAK